MATPAAPAPEITARRSPSVRPVSFAAFRSAASVTIAVPCWSSWKTGMSSRSWSLRSISKHRGVEMSSRLTPPNEGASRTYGLHDLVDARAVQRDRHGIHPAELLEQDGLALHHGREASGPMSPSPSTAVPSVTTATTDDFHV